MLPTRPHLCTVCGSRDHTVVATGTDYQYRTVDRKFDWCCCTVCRHYYINPIPSEEALPVIYPAQLKNYDDFDAHPGLAFRAKALLDGRGLERLAAGIPEGGRVLDVGCAAGTFLDLVKAHVPAVRELEGLDISEAAAAGAKRKGYPVHIGTIESVELPRDHYDLIYMQQVIEHVHDPRAVLKKLKGSLKVGGLLVMETPHLHSWDHWLFRRGYWEGYHIPRHFNLWTVEGMTRIVKEIGFAKLEHHKRIKPVHWTVSLQNWAIATSKPKAVVNFFDVRNPLLLVLFGVVDVVQLALFKRASDIQYIATR